MINIRKKRVEKLTYVDDTEYVRNRILDTFVSYKGGVVHIVRINKDQNDFNVEFRDERGIYKEGFLSELDLSVFKYGFLNYNGTATYVQRLPLRHDWKQGNRLRHLTFRGVGGYPSYEAEDLRGGMWDLLPTIQNEFYSKEECLEMLDDGYLVRAFNRDFAICHSNKAYYRSFEVGSVNKDNGKITLYPENFWLQEQINELNL